MSGAAAEFVLACKKHGVKRPNPTLVDFFTKTEPIAQDIEEINLSNNYIGNRGILALMDVIETNLPNFRSLSLQNQKLYNTDLSDDSVKGNATIDRVVEVFRSHPNVTALDLSKNPVSNYAGRKVLSLTQMNARMCRVDLQDTRIDFDIRKRIAAQCEKNATSLWESQTQDGGVEADAPFGAAREWDPKAVRAPDLSSLGAAAKPRRTIHAEGVDPEKAKRFVAPFHEKSPEDIKLIVELLSHNVLFSFLSTKDLKTVAGAMTRQDFKKGDEIMTAGGVGDALYVLQSGSADIFREGQKVFVKTPGTAVGEIELMYESPTVATVKVCTDTCTTWKLDRDTYRNLVMGAAIRRREQYTAHLQRIPFLESLSNYEKMQIADALSTDEWEAGDIIIQFDTEGEWMYILLEGEVEVIGRKEGEKTHVCDFGPGDHFGELEFLNNHRTVADVCAKTAAQTAKLNRRHFEMCMGPVMEVLKRNTKHPKYEYYQCVLQAQGIEEKP